MPARRDIDTSRPALVRLCAESTTTDVATASAFLGISVNTGYSMIEQSSWPTPVLRLGRKMRIPTAELARTLGVDLSSADAAVA